MEPQQKPPEEEEEEEDEDEDEEEEEGVPPPGEAPPPWGVPWEGEGEPLPVLGGVAAPLLLRGETERLVRELGRARPLPRLPHLKRVRGGPGGAALLLCLDSQLGPGRGATDDATEATTGCGSSCATSDTDTGDVTADPGSNPVTGNASASVATGVTTTTAGPGSGCVTRDTDTANVADITAGPGPNPAARDTSAGIATGVTTTTAGRTTGDANPGDITGVTATTTDPGSSVVTGDADPGNVTAAPGPNPVPGNTDSGVTPTDTGATAAVSDVPAAPLPPLQVLLGPRVSPRGLGPPFRVKVPGRAPAQGAETASATASSLWPWVRRGGAAAPSPSPPPLDAVEARAAVAAMRRAVAAARRGARRGMVPAGAAAVEPATGRVLATAHDGRRGDHPLAHAAIACLAAVARRRRRRGDGADGADDGYLCAGCDVYLTREPCALCAMALVHARVRRVLFGVAVPQGALGTRYGLHGRRALNHRYRVYGGVAARRCARLARLDRGGGGGNGGQ